MVHFRVWYESDIILFLKKLLLTTFLGQIKYQLLLGVFMFL